MTAMAVLAVAGAAAFQSRGAGSDPAVKVLSPAGWFKVPAAADSWSLQGFQAAQGRLFFLFGTLPSEVPNRSAVIETDSRGEGLRHRLDAPGAAIEEMTVDSSGQIMTRLRTTDPLRRIAQIATIWGPDGALKRRFETGWGPLGFHEGRPVVIRDSALVFLDAPAGDANIQLPEMGPIQGLSFVRISDSSTGVVSRLSGELAVVEGSSLVRRVRLADPEMDGLQRDTAGGQLMFLSVATDEQGRLYSLLTPFKDSEGPAVIVFNDTGQLLQRYRAIPAMLAHFQTSRNPSGHTSPWAMAATGRELFLVSGTGSNSTVVWYNLPGEK